MKNVKRISRVTIKRIVDESPDTSWLGEYSNRARTEYAIDREHDLDCPINTGETPLDSKTRTAIHAEAIAACECADSGCKVHTGKSVCANRANTILYRVDMDDASGTLMCSDCADDATTSGLFTEADDPELREPQCDCGESGNLGRHEYQYFNGPVENYKGESDADIRKYVRQDYERMERLNAGDWCFIGIRADAEILIPSGDATIVQEITSGGLWGVESDSDASYLKEIQDEQLSELREQLHSLGFSKRATARAVKDAAHANV